MKMKIAIDISQIVYEGTGVANYTRFLVKNLLKIDKDNQYLLFGVSFRRKGILEKFYSGLKSIHQNVEAKFIPIPQTIGNLLWNQLHTFNLDYFLGKVDIFHSSDWIQPPINTKRVTTVHDLIVYKFPQTSHSQIIRTQKKRMKWVLGECQKIVVDSESTKKDLIEILKAKPERIEVVYPGIDEIFKPLPKSDLERTRRKYGLGNDYFLAVGTQEPRKNLNTVISAFNEFTNKQINDNLKRELKLVIVGRKGWGEKIITQKNVKVLGMVNEKDLIGLYAGAKFFIYPSLYEGFGLPILEAMACGTPVITSNRGSLKEVAADSALLVDPESEKDLVIKMKELFTDKKLQERLREKGIKNAAKYHWETTARKMLTIYQNL